ncbi:MAG: hypothetical protein AAGG81_02920 [Chlamydiota bacterium]
MTKIILHFLLVISAIYVAPLHPTDARTNMEYTIDQEELIDYKLFYGDKSMWLDMFIHEQLKFDRTYHHWKIKNGLGCSVQFQPLDEVKVYSPSGDQLEAVTIKIVMKNAKKTNTVNCTVSTTIRYQSLTLEQALTYSVPTSALCLKEVPQFFIDFDNQTNGWISFTKQ